MRTFQALLLAAAAASSTFAADLPKGAGLYASMDPGQVRLGGEIGRRIDLTISKNLLAVNVDNDFLKPFHEKQSSIFAYIGLGKLLDATVNFAYYSRDPKVVELKKHLLTDLLGTQLEDGYIGTFPAGARLRDIFDEHEIAYVIHALVDDYQRFHDASSLQAAQRLADYFVTNYKTAVASRDPKLVCTIDVERALLLLSAATGNTQYRDYILERDGLRGWNTAIDLVNDGQYSSGNGHAYTFMNRCLAQLDLYREEPDQNLLGQSHRVIDFLTNDDGLMITGTCGMTERFRNNQETQGEVGETCATAYLIRLTHHLLQLEGETISGDIMERALYNALFASQSPDGRRLRYYTAIEGPRKYFDQDTYCCPNNWRRIIAELPEMVYYVSADGGVMVNLYTASSAKIALSGDLEVQVRQETDYPNSGKVVLRVDPSRPADLPLKLRIPRWCASATVSVNGTALAESIVPGTYCTIRRCWNAGDSVELDMPMTWRMVQGRKLQAGEVAVMRGPVVFSLSRVRNPGLGQIDLKQLRLDPASLAEPVADNTVRPDGLACPARAWGPNSDPASPPDLCLLLTEFPDPTAEATYFLTTGPDAGAPDELCGPQAAGAKAIKKDRILFLGNSITLHGPAESIGWTGNWGMAASAAEKDYVHLVVQALSEPAASGIPAPEFLVLNIADFERQYATFPIEEKLREAIDFKPDLLILAIGENVAELTTDESKAQFHTRLDTLLKAFQKDGAPTIVVRSSFGPSPTKDPILKQAASDAGALFVDIEALAGDEGNYARSERQIAHAGVAGHPGDRGMKAIADAIVDAIKKGRKP